MLKNIGKSALWLMLYFVASIVGAAIVMGTCSAIYPNLSQEEIMAKSTVLSLIAAAVVCIFVYVIYKLVRKHTFDIKSIQCSKTVFAINLGFVANCIITFIVAILVLFIPESITESMTQATDAVSDTSNNSFFILFIGTGILVPIMEELIFRYGIYGTLARSNKIVAAIISSLVFGVMHGNLIQGTYATILGLIFAFLYEKGNNIWYSIFMHAAINSVSVFITIFPELSGLILLGIGFVGMVVCIIMLSSSKAIKEMVFLKSKDYTLNANNNNPVN